MCYAAYFPADWCVTSMPCQFEYDFFISYPHMNEDQLPHLVTEFADTLAEKLSFIRQYTDTKTAFIDKNRLRPGFRWEPAIAQALCRSRCLILVYNDQYFTREYCILEFRAMCALEAKRAGKSGNGKGNNAKPKGSMIIPVIVQSAGGEDETPVLPPEVQEFEWYDFRSILDPSRQFKNKKYLEKVREIYKRVEDLRKSYPTPVVDCSGFDFAMPVQLKPEPIEAFAGAWTPPPSDLLPGAHV